MIQAALESHGVNEKLFIILESTYENAKVAVKAATDLGELFKEEKGLCQGHPISPNLFPIYLEWAMQRTQELAPGIKIHGHNINNLKLAEIIDLTERS